MKHYTRGQFTLTFVLAGDILATFRAVTAILEQLKPGAVIDDMTMDTQVPFVGARRLVITYREPAEKGN